MSDSKDDRGSEPSLPETKGREANAGAANGAGASTAKNGTNVWLRILSGAVMAGVGLLIAYLGALPFAILTFAIAAVMSWEWTRIVRGNIGDLAFYVHIVAVAVAAVLTGLGMAGLAIVAVATGALVVFALLFGRSHPVLSMLGVIYTGLPVITLGWLRGDGSLGFLAAVFVLAVVAIADTAAFFAGRSIGGARLMPSVSPNKTWSGLIGGVLAASVFGAAYPFITGSGDMVWLACLGVLLALIGQAGDLAESALKRRFALKDASDLIPGHGGFMDRMDGVVTASIAAAIIAFAIDLYAPARALLYGS